MLFVFGIWFMLDFKCREILMGLISLNTYTWTPDGLLRFYNFKFHNFWKWSEWNNIPISQIANRSRFNEFFSLSVENACTLHSATIIIILKWVRTNRGILSVETHTHYIVMILKIVLLIGCKKYYIYFFTLYFQLKNLRNICIISRFVVCIPFASKRCRYY